MIFWQNLVCYNWVCYLWSYCVGLCPCVSSLSSGSTPSSHLSPSGPFTSATRWIKRPCQLYISCFTTLICSVFQSKLLRWKRQTDSLLNLIKNTSLCSVLSPQYPMYCNYNGVSLINPSVNECSEWQLADEGDYDTCIRTHEQFLIHPCFGDIGFSGCFPVC